MWGGGAPEPKYIKSPKSDLTFPKIVLLSDRSGNTLSSELQKGGHSKITTMNLAECDFENFQFPFLKDFGPLAIFKIQYFVLVPRT